VPNHAFYVDDDHPAFLDDSAPAPTWREVGGTEQADAHVD